MRGWSWAPTAGTPPSGDSSGSRWRPRGRGASRWVCSSTGSPGGRPRPTRRGPVRTSPSSSFRDEVGAPGSTSSGTRAHLVAFSGRDAGDRILQRLATLTCFPAPEIFREARPRPGWASFPMGDTWSERPYVQGAVLIGDAAGYSDPIIGQGLTVAVRDARLVGEALL